MTKDERKKSNSEMDTQETSQENSSGFFGWIERVGNKLPHPVVIFIVLAAIVMAVSAILSAMNFELSYFDSVAQEDSIVVAESLLSREGINYIFNNLVSNFTGFAPLGTVLVAMLGVGIAEWTGLISTSMKKLLENVPPMLLSAAIVFAGINSNIASDVGYVVVVPLGAIIFAGAGRHPIAGLAAAFAGVSGGFSANLLVGPTDALLQGLTNEALASANLNYDVAVTANWYFLIASTFILTIVGAWVTDKIIEPRLGEYNGNYKPDQEDITSEEARALKLAGISLLIYAVIMAYLMFDLGLPGSGFFRAIEESTGEMSINPFLSTGLMTAIFLLFTIPGITYGVSVGKIKDSNDFVEGMKEAMGSMSGYIVLAFFAAQLINYFNYSNLGKIISISGANFLQNAGFGGPLLIFVFILLVAFINLFMGSASAKWAILAPIFVPMFYNLGITPEMTQIAYRVADSTTNIISPLMTYFPMILIFMKRYDKDSGIGTLISTMLTYSLAFLAVWSVVLLIWYALGIPLGPGAHMTI